MRVLVVTNLFPNALEPNRGLFNLQPLEELRKEPGVSIRIVAPVPWSPGAAPGRWRRYAALPAEEDVRGFRVYHPRYVVIPGILRDLHGLSYYMGIQRRVERLRDEFPFDVILATWAYPDAVGAMLVSRRLGVPCLVKVHGTDVNEHTRHRVRRRMITWALRRAPGVIAVSEPLRQTLVRCGVPADSITVLENGVNATAFEPMPRGTCRRQLSLDPADKIVLYVGNLKPAKGTRDLLEAFSRLEVGGRVRLFYVGDGPDSAFLEQQIRRRGLAREVVVAGARPHDEIPVWLNASDLLCLPSHSEGCPNVVLEAMACGTPVVATRVGQIPGLLDPSRGVLVRPGDIASLSEGLRRGLALPAPPLQDADNAPWASWRDNARAVHRLLDAAVAARG